jgi:hypothetical protein
MTESMKWVPFGTEHSMYGTDGQERNAGCLNGDSILGDTFLCVLLG